MTDLKDIKKLVDYMRKVGICKLTDGTLHIELSPDAPPKRAYTRKNTSKLPQADTQTDMIPTDSLSEEELLYYSAGGIPDELKDN